MKRYVKLTATGEYKRSGMGWGSIEWASIYNNKAVAHRVKRALCILGYECAVVVLRKKPNVSDAERAHAAYTESVRRADGTRHNILWADLSQAQRNAWEAAAKAARSRK